MELGSYPLVRYELPGPPIWHERLIIGTSRQPGWRAICTPDGDTYMEDYRPTNNDIAEFRATAGHGIPVHGILNRRVYRFAAGPPAGGELDDLYRQGEALVAIHNAALGPLPLVAAPGVGPGGMAPFGMVAAGATQAVGDPIAIPRALLDPLGGTLRVAPAGGVFVLDEPAAGYDVGAAFEVPAHARDSGTGPLRRWRAALRASRSWPPAPTLRSTSGPARTSWGSTGARFHRRGLVIRCGRWPI